MTRSLLIITILFCLALNAFSQTASTTAEKELPIRALAKMVSPGMGLEKIHHATYYIIKDLGDSSLTGQTIDVHYTYYKPIVVVDDTVLLTIYKHSSQMIGKKKQYSFYACPDFDGKLGVQKVKLDYISFEHWEACETGKGCPTLTFTRKKNESNWFLIMPCGGTQTSVTVSGVDNAFSKTMNLFAKDCPPRLELTNLPDGKYTAYMMACGLGGAVYFTIKTE